MMGLNKKRAFDTSALYKICVYGSIDKKRMEYFGGLAVLPEEPEADEPCTVLAGELADQAALVGVLNTLYNLGFALISVERLTSNSAFASQ